MRVNDLFSMLYNDPYHRSLWNALHATTAQYDISPMLMSSLAMQWLAAPLMDNRRTGFLIIQLGDVLILLKDQLQHCKVTSVQNAAQRIKDKKGLLLSGKYSKLM